MTDRFSKLTQGNIVLLAGQQGDQKIYRIIQVDDEGRVVTSGEIDLSAVVSPMEYWSAEGVEIDLPAVAADVNLPDVLVENIPAGSTIIRAVAIIKCRHIENTNGGGTNGIQGAQNIRVKATAGAWGVDDIAAIALADNMWLVAASLREGGDVVEGNIDISSVVVGNGLYNFRFEDADVDLDFLRLNDVQMGIKVYFRTT